MNTLIVSQWKKLLHSRSFWIILLVYSCVCVATPFMVSWDKPGSGWRDFFCELYDTGLWMGGCAFTAAFLIGKDFSQKTIDHEIYLGYSRGDILLSRALVFFPSCLLMVIILVSATLLGTTSRVGWGDASFGYSISAFFAGLTMNFGISCLLFLFPFLFRKTGLTLAVGVLYSFVAEQFLENIRNIEGPCSWIPSVKAAHFRFLFSNGHMVPLADLWTASGIALILFVILFSATFCLFRRQDLR